MFVSLVSLVSTSAFASFPLVLLYRDVVRPCILIVGSAFFLEGGSSEFFPVGRGVTRGCTLSSALFLVCMDGLLRGLDRCPQLGVGFSGGHVSGWLFADDFVRLAETGPALQCLVDVVFNCGGRWRFEAGVGGCAVVGFSKT